MTLDIAFSCHSKWLRKWAAARLQAASLCPTRHRLGGVETDPPASAPHDSQSTEPLPPAPIRLISFNTCCLEIPSFPRTALFHNNVGGPSGVGCNLMACCLSMTTTPS